MVSFKVEHLDLMEVKKSEMEKLTVIPNWEEGFELMQENGHAFTMIYDGRIIACGGVIETSKGIAYCWLLPSKWVDKYMITFAKTVKRFFEQMTRDLGIYRFETNCNVGSLYSNWMGFLDFEKEGIRKQAGEGRVDLITYARIV